MDTEGGAFEMSEHFSQLLCAHYLGRDQVPAMDGEVVIKEISKEVWYGVDHP